MDFWIWAAKDVCLVALGFALSLLWYRRRKLPERHAEFDPRPDDPRVIAYLKKTKSRI